MSSADDKSRFVAFFDECGDHSMEKIDKDFRWRRSTFTARAADGGCSRKTRMGDSGLRQRSPTDRAFSVRGENGGNGLSVKRGESGTWARHFFWPLALAAW